MGTTVDWKLDVKINRKILRTEFKYETQAIACYCQFHLVEDSISLKIWHCKLCPNVCTQYYEVLE